MSRVTSSAVGTEAVDLAFQLINGFRATRLVRTACELRILDLVSEAPRTASDLATWAGVPEAPVHRVLRRAIGGEPLNEEHLRSAVHR